jgi:DNA-directed RNA polymerase subunit RPC12/RpoP
LGTVIFDKYKEKNKKIVFCLSGRLVNGEDKVFKIEGQSYGAKEIYEEMYTEQSGKCFTCNNNYDILYIDHNHSTNKLRKLLCRDCNSAIGFLKENINTLNNIIKYLKKHG